MTVTEKQGEGGPLLRPYPDWSWYKDDCKGITGGVYQIEVSIINIFYLSNNLYIRLLRLRPTVCWILLTIIYCVSNNLYNKNKI